MVPLVWRGLSYSPKETPIDLDAVEEAATSPGQTWYVFT
jgi:hypothetical protein